MSFLPDSASFHERVQDCFVAYRGHGLALSAQDVDLVDRWAAAQVPFEVVARGIRKAAEAAHHDAAAGDSVMSLKACKRQVDAEIQKYLKRAVGRGGPADSTPLHLARHQKLVAALKKFAKEHDAFRRLLSVAQSLPEPANLEAADRQEHLAMASIVRTLPFAERLVLMRRSRAQWRRALPVSRSARLEALRFHRGAALRSSLDVPGFW